MGGGHFLSPTFHIIHPHSFWRERDGQRAKKRHEASQDVEIERDGEIGRETQNKGLKAQQPAPTQLLSALIPFRTVESQITFTIIKLQQGSFALPLK